MSTNNKTGSSSTNKTAVVGHWIYRTTEGNIGPIETEEFLALVQNGTVLPQTLVRLSDSTQWMKASEIGGLEFPAKSKSPPPMAQPESDSITKEQRIAHNREMQRLFAECVDRQRSVNPTPHRVPARSSSVRFELPFKGFFSSIFSYVSDKGSSALETSTSFTSQVASFIVHAIWSRVVWLSLVLLVLVVILNPKLPATWASQRKIHSVLQATLTELKELRTKNSDDATWDAFRQQYSDKVGQYIPGLMSATGETQIAPSLLTVSRYLMPALLEDREGKDVETQKRVEAFLAKANEALNPPINLEKIFSTLMIVLDVVAVVAVVAYFGRGWIWRVFAAR